MGYDIDPARRRAMARAGVEIADDADDARRQVPTIITSLPKPAALDATVSGDRRRASVRPRVIVEASTFTIDDKLKAERALRKAGHVMLDCPVSGTGAQAQGEGPGHLCQRRQQGDPQAAPAVCRHFRARRTTSARSATAAA